jgi:Uncharacterized conserved protein
MDSLHTGYSTNLILIDTSIYTLYINGKLKNFKSENIGININKPAFFNVDHNEEDVIIKTITSNDELANNSSNFMYPCFFEDSNYEILIEAKSEKNIKVYHISDDINKNIKKLGNCLIGSFSFKGEIGHSNFKILVEGKEDINLTIEIFPSKMDYMDDYYEIMNEINEEIASLTFNFLGSTYHRAKLKDVEYQTNTEFFNILKTIYKDLFKALNRIAKSPKHELCTYERTQDINKVTRISNNTSTYMSKHPETLLKSDKGISINGQTYMPRKVIEIKKENTTDIFENRFVKYIIRSIVKRLTIIENNLKEKEANQDEYLKIIANFKKNLNTHLNTYYKNIKDIYEKASMSLVFQMTSGYKEVFYYYTILKKGLDICDDVYSITPKKIWNLYEIWCYIKLHNILKEIGYDVVNYGIVSFKDNGLSLSLLQNKEAVMTYRNKQGETIELWYNKSYKNLPTTSQRPDTVLCLKTKSTDEKIYIFDAKYRVFISNGVVGPHEEDINVMHRYRDSIVSELNDKYHFRYNTFGAYVMFPYSNEKEFKNHKFYKSIEKVNIGAFPMLPGSYGLIKDHILKIISESYIEAKERLIVHDEYDNYSKFKLKNIMVVNIKDDKHLQAYRDNKFFHIPTESLKNIQLGVEYVAFYEPKGKSNIGGIMYYAKIKEVRKYKRSECKEIPKDNDEEYLRFELEDIIKLDRLIEPVEYGIRLIVYTTLYLLKNAYNVHELHFKNIREIDIYKWMRNYAITNNAKLIRHKDYYELGKNKIEILDNGKLKINDKVNDGRYPDL